MRLVFDLEANGLYNAHQNKTGDWEKEADTIWCIVTKDIDTGEVHKYKNGVICTTAIESGIEVLQLADELIGHNIIDYDLRLIKKLYPSFSPKCLVLDTYILSSLLNPDRKGGHSLGQYGEELGIAKPVHEDWSKFSPEMLHRCTEDVHINHKVYELLMEEAYEDVRGLEYHKIFTGGLT